MNTSAKCAVAAVALFLFTFLIYFATGDIFYFKCCIATGFYFAFAVLCACAETIISR